MDVTQTSITGAAGVTLLARALAWLAISPPLAR
jgi:hypothetical protein